MRMPGGGAALYRHAAATQPHLRGRFAFVTGDTVAGPAAIVPLDPDHPPPILGKPFAASTWRRCWPGYARTGRAADALSGARRAGSMAGMSWSARQYAAFEDDRTRPVRDLVAAIPPVAGGRAIDLGCGPGNSTEVLAARFPHAVVEGLDGSADMIAAARARLPALRFTLGTVEAWDDPGPFGAILANAVLHWVPDHAALLPRLVARLAPGGSLAVQMPDNLEEPAHVLMREVAADGPWAPKLAAAGAARTTLGGVDWYHRTLKPHAVRVDIWRTTYHHILPGGPDAVVEWFRGSGLMPFLAPLDAAERAGFLDRYRARIAATHPTLPDGSVMLAFPRLFMVATR
jgi:trans-aconitate 2-methyltransferase